MRFSDTAATFGDYVSDLKHLVDAQRERQQQVEALRASGGFRLAADPLRPLAAPAAETLAPALDFKPLDGAVGRLKAAATTFDAAQARAGAALPADKRRELNNLLAGMEQKLTYTSGLPGRPWYRNLAYAPGVLTGYGSKTFPGVREAIEGGRYAEAQQFIGATAGVIGAYAAELEHATAIIG
jgi:N-acetylated-alpha-linked acidic dipeptidase